MSDYDIALELRQTGRSIRTARSGEEALGPLKWLPGTWENANPEHPAGWNMIALPFSTEPDTPFNYRLLVNQYKETLTFSKIDENVPNRGIGSDAGAPATQNQFIVTLDYQQQIAQVAAEDRPESGDAGDPGADIHHEPGLFLFMKNFVTKQINLARLGSIPHGNAILAMGAFRDEGFGADIFDGAPGAGRNSPIPDPLGTPVGVPFQVPPDDLEPDEGYLDPYGFYNKNPFKGTVGGAGFPGFNPVRPARLLHLALNGFADQIIRTTRLGMRTDVMDGDISNIPFIVREANATLMDSTFWIYEMEGEGVGDDPSRLMMQYLQIVNLDFFPRVDGTPGLIIWPHVSINTLVKTAPPPED